MAAFEYPQKWKGYYLTAYGLAVKHGFEGTEEEWLKSLKSEVEFCYEDGQLKWRDREGEDWQALHEFADFTSELRAEGNAAQQASAAANTAAAAAQAGAGAANTAAAAADTAATAANAAAEAAATAKEKAETQANYAKEQGDRAKTLTDQLEGTDAGSLAADIWALQEGKADLKNGKVAAGQLPKLAKKAAVFTVGTSRAGWTEDDCDYLCDGTDDQAELNQALVDLAASASYGGEIRLLPGDYNISAPIRMQSDSVTLSGDAGVVLYRMWDSTDNAYSAMLKVMSTDCVVQNLTFRGKKDVYTNSYNTGVHIAGQNNMFRGNVLLECSGNGVITNGNRNFIVDNITENCPRGIAVSGSCHTVQGNHCDVPENPVQNSPVWAGIYLLPGSQWATVSGNTCICTTPGLLDSCGIVVQGKGHAITGNVCVNLPMAGIHVAKAEGISVTGNSCSIDLPSDCWFGIDCDGSRNVEITGNVLRGGWNGLIASSDCEQFTISGNVCAAETYTADSGETVKGDTMVFYGCNTHLVSGNLLLGNDCKFDGGTGNTVVNNKCG